MYWILGLSALVSAAAILIVLRPWQCTPPRITVDVKPDAPAAFGYRTAWLALRTRDTLAVIDQLGLEDLQRANWNGGLAAAYDERLTEDYVFVSPPVAGWTFVVGLALPYPAGAKFADRCTPLLMALGRRFIEVQYYFTYPVIDFYAWARVIDGKLVRAFAWGDDGIMWNNGRVTKEERQIGLRLLEPCTADGHISTNWKGVAAYPNEDHVVALASRWGMDPTRLDEIEAMPALGFIGRIPASWRLQRLSGGEDARELPDPEPPSAPARRGKPDLRPVS